MTQSHASCSEGGAPIWGVLDSLCRQCAQTRRAIDSSSPQRSDSAPGWIAPQRLAWSPMMTTTIVDISDSMSTGCRFFDRFRRKSRDKPAVECNETDSRMAQNISSLLVFFSGLLVAFLLACFSPLPDYFLRMKLIQQKSFLPAIHHVPSSDVWFQTRKPLTSSKQESKEIDLRNEAVSAMHLALEMQEKGKLEKAAKLFQHAYALDPSHADLAYHYGHHLERHLDDIILADHLYTKALVLNPDHGRAMIRQQRISPLVRELDQRTLTRIDSKRDELYKIPDHHPGLRRIKHESYISHIYHTVAIEGNSMTYSQARHIIETKMAIEGKSIMEHNELLGVDNALRYINSTLLRRWGQIELDDILEIHRRILGPVDPAEAGRMRGTQVFIAEHRPPPADELLSHMSEFVGWLNAPSTLRLHPIEYAALAHYKLVYIHPFFDGNGRTSRLLMNLIMMQSGYPPVTIRVDEKHKYYQHIVSANQGDVRPFIRFIAECTERTLDEFLMCATRDTHDLVISDHFERSLAEEGNFVIKDGT